MATRPRRIIARPDPASWGDDELLTFAEAASLLWRHCDDKESRGRTVTLKVKFNDFEIITRSRSVPAVVSSRSDFQRLAVALLQNEMPPPKPVRLLGISLSSLQDEI
jgi:nucleotidyltransferase/DNA polymerase involved in DNA repair